MIKDLKGADDILMEIQQRNISTIFESRHGLENITGTEKNQGIAAKVEGIQALGIEEFLSKIKGLQEAVICVLDGVEDPHNLGAIIRSCEIFGVCGIIQGSKRAAPLNETVYKASSGALEYVDVIQATNIVNVLLKLKDMGFWIYGFDAAAEKFLDESNFDKKSALVFGSEGRGMRDIVKNKCDFLLKIRQKGKIGSLNVSNAAAIAFYEASKGKN
jgi:23S rRNA (guanosine2251-2'-O)-methyltransferase